MSQRIVVTGTDTGIGKTVFAAGLAGFLGAKYWKPIQAGLDEETDSRRVARLGRLSNDRIVPERYSLKTPASPYRALPVVLCARTALGTINHSLLSVEALRNRKIEILGIAFIGDQNSDSENAICEIAQVRRLGRLPRLSPLATDTLRVAFRSSFNRDDFS